MDIDEIQSSRLDPRYGAVDHVLPTAAGGRAVWSYEVMTCAACNNTRHHGNALARALRTIQRSGTGNLQANPRILKDPGEIPDFPGRARKFSRDSEPADTAPETFKRTRESSGIRTGSRIFLGAPENSQETVSQPTPPRKSSSEPENPQGSGRDPGNSLGRRHRPCAADARPAKAEDGGDGAPEDADLEHPGTRRGGAGWALTEQGRSAIEHGLSWISARTLRAERKIKEEAERRGRLERPYRVVLDAALADEIIAGQWLPGPAEGAA